MFLPKKGQKKSNLAQFAWKLLESKSGTGEVAEPSNSAMGLHLKAIFLSLDSDNDDYITRPQLIEAIRLAGLNPREHLIRKYAQAKSATATSNDQPQDAFLVDFGNVAKRKQSVVPPLFFKTDLATFVCVTESELNVSNKLIERDLIHLLRQFAEPGTDEISVMQIRHILHETLAPTRLTVLETAELLNSCELGTKSTTASSSSSKGKNYGSSNYIRNGMNMEGEASVFVDIPTFVHKLLVGHMSDLSHSSDPSQVLDETESEGMNFVTY